MVERDFIELAIFSGTKGSDTSNLLLTMLLSTTADPDYHFMPHTEWRGLQYDWNSQTL